MNLVRNPTFRNLKPDELGRLQEVAVWATKILQPPILLHNLCGLSEREMSFGNRSGIAGGYTDGYGKPHRESILFPFMIAFVEQHTDFIAVRERLATAKINLSFFRHQEANIDGLDIFFPVDKEVLRGLNELARQDLGARTTEQSKDFDEHLNIFSLQNYGANFEEWRKRLPIAEWPWKP